MNCRQVSDLLGAYLDQALNAEQLAQIEHHLQQCDRCWQEMAGLMDLQHALDDPALEQLVLHEPSPLPADFTAQVIGRIEAERPVGLNVFWPWLRGKWSKRQYASAAYALSATLVVVSAINLLFLWTDTTNQATVWSAKALAYWEATSAYVDGIGAYMGSVWSGILTFLQLG